MALICKKCRHVSEESYRKCPKCNSDMVSKETMENSEISTKRKKYIALASLNMFYFTPIVAFFIVFSSFNIIEILLKTIIFMIPSISIARINFEFREKKKHKGPIKIFMILFIIIYVLSSFSLVANGDGEFGFPILVALILPILVLRTVDEIGPKDVIGLQTSEGRISLIFTITFFIFQIITLFIGILFGILGGFT